MRKIINSVAIGTTLFSLMLFFSPVTSAAQEPHEVVNAYFQAMKNGDVVTMKSYLGGKLYEKRRILLEQNANYPKFLRNHFESGDVQVGEVKDGIVKVMIQFPDGSRQSHQMVVEQDSSGQWKIVDEISRDR